MASRQNERRERRIADAGRRVTEHASGDRMCLAMPQGLGLWKPKKVGAYIVSFIPFEMTDTSKKFRKSYANPGDWYFERTYYAHRGIGLNQDMVVCLRETFNKPCPICEFMMKLARSPRKEDVELLADLKTTQRQLFLVLDHEDERAGVQLWDISFAMFGKGFDNKIAMADERRRNRYRRFYDFGDAGMAVRLTCQEKAIGDKGKTNEYMVDEFRERGTEYPVADNFYDHGYNLDDIVREIPYDQLKEMFLQTGGTQEGDSGGDGGDDDRGEDRGVTRPAASGRNGTHRDESRGGDDDGDDGGAWGRTTGTSGARDPEPERRRAPDPEPATRDRGEYTLGDAAVGDEVEWDKGDAVVSGTVAKVDKVREIAEVTVEGRERPAVVDLDRLRVVRKADKGSKEAPEKAAKPETRKAESRSGGGRGWDDDEDDDRGGKPEPAKKGRR